MTMITNKEIEN